MVSTSHNARIIAGFIGFAICFGMLVATGIFMYSGLSLAISLLL